MKLASRSFLLYSTLAAGLLTGCAGTQRWPWVFTQRWPGPMEATQNPLPKGDVLPAGPEEVSIVRHADPARVRLAGMASSFPMRFFEKDMRVSAGSAVYTASGGRLEVIWPNGNSIVITGASAGVVGSPSRGDPCFHIQQVERALINFKIGDQIELVGGSVLRAKSGPFVVEMSGPNVLRVKNQSDSAGEVAFREATFVLDPGAVLDLPLLSVGGTPSLRDAPLTARDGPGFPIRYSGAVDVEDQGSMVRVSASGEHAIHALGVRVKLRDGETAVLGGLARPAPRAVLASSPNASPPTGAEQTDQEAPPTTPP